MEKQFPSAPRMHVARTACAFTLVELLLATAVLSLILIVATSVMTQTQKTWLQASARTEQFREARLAFELITQNLSKGTLNTYMTYQYNEGSTPTVPVDKLEVPKKYIRHSELQFVTGSAAALLGGAGNSLPGHAVFFQGAIGVSQRDGYESMNRLLCGRGYFVMHGDDSAYRPAHVTQARTRFRLMEYRPPAERNEIYSVNPGLWFKDAHHEIIGVNETATHSAYTRPVTENILALIISPQVPASEAKSSGKSPAWIAPTYAYDSVRQTNQTSNNFQGTQHLLPPLVQVTLVALDENSARRLEDRAGGATPDVLPSGAFQSASQYQSDMQSLEAKLREEKLNYRIFSATVPLRNSKWAMYGH